MRPVTGGLIALTVVCFASPPVSAADAQAARPPAPTSTAGAAAGLPPLPGPSDDTPAPPPPAGPRAGDVTNRDSSNGDRAEAGDDSAPAPAPPAPRAPTVTVHIDSPEPVSLERRLGGHGDFVPVCDSPCDQPMGVDAEYRITGQDIRPTKAFGLRGPQTRLRVSPSSNGAFKAGIVLTAVGGGAIIVGAVILDVTLLAHTLGALEGGTGDTGAWSIVGGVTVGAGAVIAGIGIPVLVGNVHSGVATEGPAEAPPGDPPASGEASPPSPAGGLVGPSMASAGGSGDVPWRAFAAERNARVQPHGVPAAAAVPVFRLAF